MADDDAAAAGVTPGEVDAGEVEEEAAPGRRRRVVGASGGWRLGVGSGGGREELTRLGEGAVDVGGCEQAVVTDLDEAGRQDVCNLPHYSEGLLQLPQRQGSQNVPQRSV